MRVELPFLAEGVEGGDVVQVLVKEGDQVTEGQSLIELETDKATVPVPAPSAGTVTHLLVKKGDHLKVGQALVELNGEGESAPQKTAASKTAADKPADEKSSDKKPAQPLPNTRPVPSPHRPRSRRRPSRQRMPRPSSNARSRRHNRPLHLRLLRLERKQHRRRNKRLSSGPSESPSPGAGIAAPPSVRRLARELGVDLGHVKGSEAGGRITAEDVKAYVRERTRRAAHHRARAVTTKAAPSSPRHMAANGGKRFPRSGGKSPRRSHRPGRRSRTSISFRMPISPISLACTSAMRRNSKRKARR